MSQQLLGRTGEQARLRDWLSVTHTGAHPRLAVIEGEAGIGKTALVHAVSDDARASGRDVRWAAGLEEAGVAPYWIWRQVVGTAEPASDRFAYFETLRSQLHGETGTVIVIDDIQWADEPSLLALRHILRRPQDTPLFVCATRRSGDAGTGWERVGPDLLSGPDVTRITLGGLDEGIVGRVLEDLVGRSLPADVVARAAVDSGGNPLFVRELGRLLAAGAGMTSGGLDEIIDARVRRLAPKTQALLRAASILAEEWELPVVARLLIEPTSACLGAVDEAVSTGMLLAVGGGRFRFSHALVRSVLAAHIPLQESVTLHQRAAEAIEDLHRGALAAALADIARHWAAVAVTGERAPAVDWSRRAADEAMRAVAYEEAARLYSLAMECGGRTLPDDRRAQLLVGRAGAELAAGAIESAYDDCRQAADLARDAGRPDVLASVALCLEPVGERRWDRSIAEWCREALSAATPDGATRARLLARLAHALVYTADYDAAGGHAVDAQNEAEASGDADALVAALRARQMTSTDPDRSDDRAELAARMTALGEQLRRPDVEMWGRLWALDVMWERGDLVGVAAEISRLHWCVEHVGTSIARWHLLVAEAALAQAQGEFDEALANARAGFELMLAMGHPAAIGAFMSLATTVGHHRGQDETTTRVAPSGVPGDTGEVRNELFAFIGPASALADAGRLDEALAAYQRPGPPQQWRIPPYFYLQALHTGASLAVTLDITDDIAWFRDQLEPHRGRHVAGGAGGANYYGPIELILGRCAAALGELDRAAADLDNARATCARIGAVGFEIEATVELASVLRRQGQDRAAHALLTRARPRALRLGMKPWIERIDRGLADSADDPLTPREREVAGLVAQGKSNKEIASTLVLSERTAANHVQHILTKLGFANRSQIAAWASTNASSE